MVCIVGMHKLNKNLTFSTDSQGYSLLSMKRQKQYFVKIPTPKHSFLFNYPCNHCVSFVVSVVVFTTFTHLHCTMPVLLRKYVDNANNRFHTSFQFSFICDVLHFLFDAYMPMKSVSNDFLKQNFFLVEFAHIQNLFCFQLLKN